MFKGMANNTKSNKRKNGKLSLYPLKFGEAVKVIVKIKPPLKPSLDKDVVHD